MTPRDGGRGPSRRSRRHAAGFTLLEILVVVAIIGVMASLAVLSIGNRALDDRLEAEARRVHELMTLALDEAVLQGVELAFAQTDEGYLFLAYQDGRWQPLTDEGPLRGRRVEPPFQLQLSIEGRPVAPIRTDDADAEWKPHVLLLSSGEATAFTLDVRARDYRPWYRLDGDALGRLTLARRETS